MKNTLQNMLNSASTNSAKKIFSAALVSVTLLSLMVIVYPNKKQYFGLLSLSFIGVILREIYLRVKTPDLAVIPKRVLFMFSIALLACFTTVLTGCGKESEQEKKQTQNDATSRLLGAGREYKSFSTPEERKEERRKIREGNSSSTLKQDNKQK